MLGSLCLQVLLVLSIAYDCKDLFSFSKFNKKVVFLSFKYMLIFILYSHIVKFIHVIDLLDNITNG
ncbi:hypothetical protein HanXRQr2_Chr04g0155391 [Helianthus annuus]|uniref:Uncharacterized protein n=1 Tax=Helianthus annuus TaxID=4232 RepID=A0A9K3NQW8_HELAN|nr:hypothetical protein HanXRQr2_Chr04g0155391 [Helianthus annuus]